LTAIHHSKAANETKFISNRQINEMLRARWIY
jgi:hypothetical protein